MEERFYFCETCGNLLITAIASGVLPYCCGKEMSLLKANVTDGDTEKHVPVFELKSDHKMRIKVGTEPHPMTGKHGIRFVCLKTTTEFIVRYLKEEEPPEACIRFTGKPIAVYAYCNIHGLWRANVPDECINECGRSCKN